MDGTKYVQQLKKKKKVQKHLEAASFRLNHVCQTHLLLSTTTLSSKRFGSAEPLSLQPLVTIN